MGIAYCVLCIFYNLCTMFRFKRFSVEHDNSSMKVGTDAVLIGAWADLGGAIHVLDVGTGCGVIALMAAQRTSDDSHIDAIDIDAASVVQANNNFASSPWAARLNAYRADINDYSRPHPYDVIVTNPPFYQEDVMPPTVVRAAARHTHLLSFDQLMLSASRLLSASGSIALITPTQARDAVTAAATFAGLHLWRFTTVHSVDGTVAKRLLWQWSKQPCPTCRDTLILTEGGEYTAQYRTLCHDFYLKF